MKRPTKPRKPKKPVAPKKYVYEHRPVLELIDFIDGIERELLFQNPSMEGFPPLEKFPEALNKVIENIFKKHNKEDIVYEVEGGLFHIRKKTPNPNYNTEYKRYIKQKEKYPERLRAYEEKLKVYEIKKPIWDAWKIKQKQNDLEDQEKKLQEEINKLKEQKKAVVEKAGISEEDIENVENKHSKQEKGL